MLSELFIYILVSLLFLSTLILPVGNYYNDINKELTENKINESMEYTQTKSQNELSDYVILANEDYVFISKSSIEDNEEENIVDQFKIDKRYFYNILPDNQAEYKGYKVIAKFSNGIKTYPKE